MEFRLLGPVEARLHGRTVDLGHPRRQCVLVALLVDANSLMSVDQLIDRVWGERAPARARETLYGYLSRLRHALAAAGDDVDLGRRAGGYVLAVDPGAVDLHCFRGLLNRARAAGADDQIASAALTQALELWRGEAFAGLATTWIDAVRDSVGAERYAAELDLADLQLREGRDAETLAALAGHAGTNPLDERLAGQLMLAWHRTGRQADALTYYERLRRQLADELGADPGPVLQELHQRILIGDPSLVPVGPVGPVGSAGSAHAPGPASVSGPGPASAPGQDPVPRQLPIPTRGFTGRAAELAELDHSDDGATVTAIAGMPGVGKTALAIHAAHRVAARCPDGQLYMDLHGATAGLTPLEPLPVLGWFLRALGTDPTAVPMTLAEAAAAFRSRTAGSSLLVVLDNAGDAAQVAPLLPAGPECRVLVTSRRPLSALDGVTHMHLDTLPAAEAVELLARLAGPDRVAAEPDAAAELIRWCGSLPLALRIAGARLATRPGWTVAALAERLADARRRLDELQLAEAGVRTSFDVSFQQLEASGDEMDTWAATAFRLLGVPDGPDVSGPVAAELLGRPVHVTERVLDRLVDAQLLDMPAPGRYRMHDLLRQYARDLAGRHRGAPVETLALTRALGWYTATAWRTLALLRPGDHRLTRMDRRWRTGGTEFADRRAALAWLDLERANLMAAVRQAAVGPGHTEIAVQLGLALSAFFGFRGHWDDWAQVSRTALEVARRSGDLAAQGQALNDLGVVCFRRGRYDEASCFLAESLAIHRKLGDRLGEAVSLTNLGNIHERQGRYEEALARHRESLGVWRSSSSSSSSSSDGHRPADRSALAITLAGLGTVSQRLGRHADALDCQQKSLAIRRELGDRFGEAVTLGRLGQVHEQQSRFAEAVACQQESLAIYRELGSRAGEASSLHDLGILQQRQGHYAHALAYQRASIAIRRAVGDSHNEAESLRELGATLRALGRESEARASWHQALMILEQLGTADADQVRDLLASAPIDRDVHGTAR